MKILLVLALFVSVNSFAEEVNSPAVKFKQIYLTKLFAKNAPMVSGSYGYRAHITDIKICPDFSYNVTPLNDGNTYYPSIPEQYSEVTESPICVAKLEGTKQIVELFNLSNQFQFAEKTQVSFQNSRLIADTLAYISLTNELKDLQDNLELGATVRVFAMVFGRKSVVLSVGLAKSNSRYIPKVEDGQDDIRENLVKSLYNLN